MLRTAVLIRWSLQDGALLTAAVWGVLVGLHLPARGSGQTPQPVGARRRAWGYRHCLLLLAACCHLNELPSVSPVALGFMRGMWLWWGGLTDSGLRCERRRSTQVTVRQSRFKCFQAYYLSFLFVWAGQNLWFCFWDVTINWLDSISKVKNKRVYAL